MTGEQLCRACGAPLPPRTIAGHPPVTCVGECREKYRKERGRQRRAANAEDIRETKRQYRLANAEKVAKHKAEYYKANKVAIRAKQNIYMAGEEQKERQRERLRAWYEANPGRRDELRAQWAAANPEKVKAVGHRRRVTKRERPADKVLLVDLLRDQGGLCGLCDQPIDMTLKWPNRLSSSMDHIIPLAKGGDGLRANLQAAHLGCNNRKRDRIGWKATG